jgi:hypothetical protein
VHPAVESGQPQLSEYAERELSKKAVTTANESMILFFIVFFIVSGGLKVLVP